MLKEPSSRSSRLSSASSRKRLPAPRVVEMAQGPAGDWASSKVVKPRGKFKHTVRLNPGALGPVPATARGGKREVAKRILYQCPLCRVATDLVAVQLGPAVSVKICQKCVKAGSKVKSTVKQLMAIFGGG